MTLLTAAEIWRNYVTDGVPGSGVNQPSKPELRQWGGWLETLLSSSWGGIGFATLSAISSDLAHAANTIAIVYGDATGANNGMYVKIGASGSGSWSRIGDLPNSVIRLTVTGGTGNAIVATSTETPAVPGNKLYLLTPTTQNSGATTIALNGGSPVAIKNAVGSALASGSLLANTQCLMAWDTDHYQLLISANVDASAILADAQAADVSAQAQATSAAASAAAAAAALGVMIYPTVAAFVAATVTFANGTMIYIHNYYAGIDGGGHWCRISSSLPSPFHYAYHVSANGKYAILAEQDPELKMFGAKRGSDAANTIAFNYALSYAEASQIFCCRVADSYTLLKRPWAMRERMRWKGNTMLGSIIARDYADDFAHALFHQIANGTGGGLMIDNLYIVSLRTTFGGCGVTSRSGRRTDITITGTPTIGEVVTINFHFSAADHNVSYTVLSGDTLEGICHGLDAAVISATTVFNALFSPAVYDNTLIIMGDPLLTTTISGSSTAALVVTVGASSNFTCGYLFLTNIEISSGNGWDYPIWLDSLRTASAGIPQVRTVDLTSVGLFGGQFASGRIDAEACSWGNGYLTSAGGLSGDLQLGFAGSPGIQDSKIDLAFIGGTLALNYVKRTTIIVGGITVDVTNTANSDFVKVMAAKIGGAQQSNWTNSHYI